ncbi:M4 family metallopeptidase [Urechidicola croceus]|uniref:Fibronectin type-III domain-containing protein n=1 Tax=Urechidicola croceus TaxID=1850246 RepID=A0A1D8P9F8_9FLAO|nr:M4 family metallopeptidase [Urechidicola croceus]AOW21185.1 hypothetical protein LPB138_11060 [Urechidicola croceus]
MKNNYFRSFIFSCALAVSIPSVYAQENETIIAQKSANQNGNPSLVVFTKSANLSLSQSKLVLKEQLKLSQNDDYQKIKSEQDQIGFTHEKYQQYFNGVKVEFGTYTVHAKNSTIESISGEFYETKNINITPTLSKEQAFQSAISHIGAQSYLWEDEAASRELGYEKPEGELVLLPIFDNLTLKGDVEKLKLAYKYEIFTIVPLGGADVYVDAKSGEILFYNARVKHVDNFGHDGRESYEENSLLEEENTMATFATAIAAGNAQTRYSGSQTIETTLSGGNYILSDASRKVYTRNANNQAPGNTSLPYISNYTEFTDSNNDWTASEFDNANKDNAALDAHWGAMMTYDYFMNTHNRDSYDNNGSQLRSYVHVDNDYDNAFWYLNVMSYGDGSSNGNEGNGYFDALTSIDVAAHELGHGVCEYTANLAYQRESGAMNEGFSDIWGAAVEHFAKGNGSDSNPDASIWLIGDEIDRRSGSAALRSMIDPTSLGQPDTYGGTNWVNPQCGTPTSNNDYCGVHTNSGVLNYWFYLLVQGGSGTNDIGSSFNVSGIGMTKAANITYRLESVYLSANSTFNDARASAIQSARDFYGSDSAEEIAVTNAWHAVGVGNAYGDTSVNYCASAGNSVSDEYISRVQFNTIDNTSGGQTYSNFTSISTDVSKDTQYSITITPTWTGTVYSEGYAVWVDYNQNGDFTDSGELVFSQTATQSTPISGSFTIPSSATDGSTRMRISMKYNGIPTACETFSYGEVEDYTLNIGSGSTGADTEAPSTPLNLVASSITETTATLSWNASTDNIGVTGYNVYQGSTSIGTVTATSANITGLTVDTSYTFSVSAIDAAGNESNTSNSVTFTTSSGVDTEAPSAPTSLTTSAITETTATLSWNASTDNVGVTSYNVYQGSTNIGSTTSTSSNITGLTASTSYSFTVTAVDAAGNESSSSNTVTFTTSSTAPTCSDGIQNGDETGVDCGGSSCTPCSTGESVVLHEGYFESGWDGWSDGGSDVARYGGSRSYQGNYSIRLRDNSGTGSAMTLSSFDVTSYDEIEVTFYFYSYSMESGEDFWVRYYDGSTWNTVAAYSQGTSFSNNSFYSATVTISKTDYNFPSNAQFRFQCDASGNSDYIYIDQVSITGISGGGAGINSIQPLNSGIGSGFAASINEAGPEFEGDFMMYPNPVKNILNIKLLDNATGTYKIVNTLGQTVKAGKVTDEAIDVSQLNLGLYIIEVNDGEEIMTQKFVKN